MRLHTDKISASDLLEATRDHLPGVHVKLATHGSRTRTQGFEVRLEGNGHPVNSGNRGAGDTRGATWDEWGVVIARLFDVDPDALWGSNKYPVYQSRGAFHVQTDWRFEDLELPEDTHRRHHWEFTEAPREFACTKCTALRRH
ncbi:MAG: hypothetical protein ACTHXC_00325 [Brachybacterium sp.]